MDHQSGEHPEFESVLADLTDLLRKWVAVIRATVADVGTLEKEHPERSKRDKIVSRWQMYLGTMIVKAAEGVADIAPSRNVRAMAILMRAVYEYQVRAAFFLRNPQKAREQFLSIPARRYAALSKMAHRTPGIAPQLTAEYLEWKRTNPDRDEWAGEVRVTQMHLQNVDASKVKIDKDGHRYTEEFVTVYGTASWYVHAAPTLFPEVFRKLDDENSWEFTEEHNYFDALTALSAVNASLAKFVLEVAKAYGFGASRMQPLHEQIARTVVSVARMHGQNVTLVKDGSGWRLGLG